MHVFEQVAQEFKRQGVEHVFGLMGEDTARLIIELDRLGIKMIAARHENQAVGMADGYARTSGRVGVVLVTSGPGFTNALTLITTAARARSRVLVIVGAKMAREDQPEFAASRISKYFNYATVCAAEGISFRKPAEALTTIAEVREAFTDAGAGATTVLNLAVDLLESAAAELPELPASSQMSIRSAIPPDDSDVKLVADFLQEGGAGLRTLILAGRGASASGAGPVLRRLGALIGAPLTTTLLARPIFAGDDYDLGICGFFGTPVARQTVEQVDCILAFGASLNRFTSYGGEFLAAPKIIQIDCDERAFGRFARARPELSLLADARLAADALVCELELRGLQLPGVRHDTLRHQIASFDRHWEFDDESLSEAVDPRSLMLELNRILPTDRVVVVDPGHHLSFSVPYLDVPDPQAFIFPIEMGSIGVGVGEAIGAAFGRPQSTIVLAEGDAGLLMALGDVETAVRYQLPIVIVITNDRALGAEVHYLDLIGEPSEMALHTTPDFADLARALGAEGYTIRSLADTTELEERFRSPLIGPVVLDCLVNPRIRGEWVELVHARPAEATS